jgi:hypothetical protein
MKKIFGVIIALLLITLPVSAKNLVYMGEDDSDSTFVFEVWMDTDEIKPVAFLSGKKVTILENVFSSKYEMKFKDYDSSIPMSGLVDFHSMKVLSISEKMKWEFDEKGADGFLYNAYLTKHYDEITARQPIVIKTNYLPKDRTPIWPITTSGWVKVYEQKDGSEAWTKPTSALLSEEGGAELPSVRILVRRSDVADGLKKVTYSYEEYNPVTKTRIPLKVWNENKEPLMSMTKDAFPVTVLSKDAAIAAEAYVPFIKNPTDRKIYKIDDSIAEIPLEWLEF